MLSCTTGGRSWTPPASIDVLTENGCPSASAEPARRSFLKERGRSSVVPDRFCSSSAAGERAEVGVGVKARAQRDRGAAVGP
jgi:hypothetical protein